MTVEFIKEKIFPILKQNNIKRAGLFGSVVKGNDTETSDIDILVELNSEISLIDFVRIKLELEDNLKRRIDLVEYRAIKPRLKKRILSEELRIYG